MKKINVLLNKFQIGYKCRSAFIKINLSQKNLEILHNFYKRLWIKQYLIDKEKKEIKVYLRYKKNKSLFRNIKLISSSGYRKYIKKEGIKKLIFKYGHFRVILYTNKGFLTLKEALNEGIGGEIAFILCY